MAGVCVNVFGINVLGDSDCRDRAREDREDRIDLRQSGHTDRVDIRQSERTERVDVRQTERTERTAITGELPGAPVADAIGGVAGGLASAALGFLGIEPDPLTGAQDATPIVLIGGALVIGLAVAFGQQRRK